MEIVNLYWRRMRKQEGCGITAWGCPGFDPYLILLGELGIAAPKLIFGK